MKTYLLTLFSVISMLNLQVFAEATNPTVKAAEEKLQRARPLDLTKIRLTGGPLKAAQDADIKYLLELEPDRMLAGYRIRAGLEPKAEGYGGWDAVDSRQLTGHIAGHYLSAISLMYAATGNEEFKKRADYIISEFKEVQDKRGNGYLGAIIDRNGTDGSELLARMAQGYIQGSGFDLNGLWSPWYTLHKTYAGLRDAYRYTGSKMALEIEIKFAKWAQDILNPLSDAQIQRMLGTEFGGMNEIMADLYADTGDEQWLKFSYKFEHESFIEPLAAHQNRLGGLHGNTQIPKLIGSIDRFAYTGNGRDIIAAGFFWDAVVQQHTFATGGHGNVENFPPADVWADVVQGSGRTAETCNVYNMLKLTRRLFEFVPNAHYADFEEKALFNHILSSINPQNSRTCYMVSVGQGVTREYQDMFRSFTCCVGTGMESHALHGEGIYYVFDKKLWVNTFLPSIADWESENVKLTVDTNFPIGETARLTIATESPKEFTMALRRPYWAGDGFSVKINGESMSNAQSGIPAQNNRGSRRGGRGGGDASNTDNTNPAPRGPSTYVEIKRTWSSGDTVELTLPKSLYLEPTPDDPNVAAIMWGPIVLAGNMDNMGTATVDSQEANRGGRRGRGGRSINVPVLVASGQPISNWLKPVEGQPGNFKTVNVGFLPDKTAKDVDLMPFYLLHDHAYTIYWNLYTKQDWESRK
ncbi:MAG: glycoside hydrolase family 127 protein [Sedimentisphaerales bacterium]|nr:glycoside hydrolase family 127 protein [Sedimentisphaerales bacterium]